MYELEEIIQYFEASNIEMLRQDVGLLNAEVSERALCGALSHHLLLNIAKTPFKDYHVDIEYNRNGKAVKTIVNDSMQIVSITCDLIVHSRGKIKEKDNLIALEMKKSSREPEEKDKDRIRLMALTKENNGEILVLEATGLPEHVCGYSLGVYYEVDFEKREISLEYYQLGKQIDARVIGF